MALYGNCMCIGVAQTTTTKVYIILTHINHVDNINLYI